MNTNTQELVKFQADAGGCLLGIACYIDEGKPILRILPIALSGQVLQLGYSQDGKRDFIKVVDYIYWLRMEVLDTDLNLVVDSGLREKRLSLRKVIESYEGLADYVRDVDIYTFGCNIFNICSIENSHTKLLLSLLIAYLIESYENK